MKIQTRIVSYMDTHLGIKHVAEFRTKGIFFWGPWQYIEWTHKTFNTLEEAKQEITAFLIKHEYGQIVTIYPEDLL